MQRRLWTIVISIAKPLRDSLSTRSGIKVGVLFSWQGDPRRLDIADLCLCLTQMN